MKRLLKRIIYNFIIVFARVFSPAWMPKIRLRMAQLNGIWYSSLFARRIKGVIVYSPFYLFGAEYISLGDNFFVDCRVRLDAFGEKGDACKLIIGNNFCAQKDCHIGAANKITIGDNVLLASKVYISDHSHGEITAEALILAPVDRPIYSKGEIHIGNNVWIGEGVTILPGVIIGENAIIGAGAVVTKSIPANCVAAGNPAKVIKELR